MIYLNKRFFIRRIFNLKSFIIRVLRQLYSIYNELKIIYFNRDYLEIIITKSSFYLFYLFFIDDFEIYKNIYYALKAFYFILIYLNYVKRRKLANVFILFLKFYNVNIKNVVRIFYKFI